MNRNKFITLALILAGLLLLVRISSPLEEVKEEASKLIVEDFSFDQIEVFEKELKLKLVKDDSSSWGLEKKEPALLDETALKSFLDALNSFSFQEKIDFADESVNYAAYGFEDPSLKLVLLGKDKKKEIAFGKLNPISQRRYARVDNEKSILMIDEAQVNSLKKDEFSLRDKTPINFNPEDITSVGIRRSSYEIVFIRKDEFGRFQYKTPFQTISIDNELLLSILRDISSLEVLDFLDNPNPDVSLYGLKPEKLAVALNFGGEKFEDVESEFVKGSTKTKSFMLDPKGKVIFFGEADDDQAGQRKYYFNIKGAFRIYRYLYPPYSDFLQDLSLLRDRTPFNELKSKQISKLEIFKDEKSFKIELEKNKDIVEKILNIRVLSYLGESGEGLGEVSKESSQLKINLTLKASKQSSPEKLAIYFGEPVRNISGKRNLEEAPRYALVKSTDGAEVPAVISSLEWIEIRELLEKLEDK